MAERTPNPVFEVIPEEILQVKIADLGNACWTVNIISHQQQISYFLSLV